MGGEEGRTIPRTSSRNLNLTLILLISRSATTLPSCDSSINAPESSSYTRRRLMLPPPLKLLGGRFVLTVLGEILVKGATGILD